MDYEHAVSLLEGFLSAPERAADCWTFHQLYGATVAILSCPEYVSDTELGFMLLGDGTDDYAAWFDHPGEIHGARVAFENAVGEQLAYGEFDLAARYPLGQAAEISDELAQWCSGYLLGFTLTQSAWAAVYEALGAADLELAETAVLKENHATLLSLIEALADFDAALGESDEPEILRENVAVVLDAVAAGIRVQHEAALELEDIAMNDAAGEEPFRREDVKVGRNDPCPCGSGKKYKKCCLQ